VPATFDKVAASYDRFRKLPAGVPAAIRSALLAASPGAPGGPLLEIGAGTGRVGAAFAAAGDRYVAVDPSGRMLAGFAAKVPAGTRIALVQADGRALPFAARVFARVLLVQVLSNVPAWRDVLLEAVRVLSAGGAIVLGQTVGPPDGVDARMRDRLAGILGPVSARPGASREDSRAWLAGAARGHARSVAATWSQPRTPRGFLDRHAAGARFGALPAETREAALAALVEWARDTFGDLDHPYQEEFRFELDTFTF
jgi:ubiquinone/menaquinone biosynthesis C-methylase UbiE